jgi:hypothetical protein
MYMSLTIWYDITGYNHYIRHYIMNDTHHDIKYYINHDIKKYDIMHDIIYDIKGPTLLGTPEMSQNS